MATDVDGNGFISVSHLTRDATGAVVPGVFGIDGVDQLKNVERLLFADGTLKITRHENRIAEGRVTIDGLAADGIAVLNQVLTASIANVTDRDGIADPVEYYWQVEAAPGTGLFTNITSIVADEFAPVKGETFTVTAAEAGLAIRVVARFKDGEGRPRDSLFERRRRRKPERAGHDRARRFQYDDAHLRRQLRHRVYRLGRIRRRRKYRHNRHHPD